MLAGQRLLPSRVRVLAVVVPSFNLTPKSSKKEVSGKTNPAYLLDDVPQRLKPPVSTLRGESTGWHQGLMGQHGSLSRGALLPPQYSNTPHSDLALL